MLLTDWVILATAGATVDGREIKESYLKDIAETYDQEKYTANINVDHKSWYGNFGSVHDVRLGKNKDSETILEGRLNPNHYLMELNKDGQKRFVSIEITPNYRNTGKAYLTGLAVTDEPASAGTSMLKFSQANSDFLYTAPLDFSVCLPGEEQQADLSEEDTTLFKRFLALVAGSQKHEFKNQTIEQEAEEMSAEQLAALQDDVSNLSKTVETLSGVVTKLGEKFTSEKPEETEEELSEVEKLSAQITALTDEVKQLKEEVPGRFKAEDHQEQPEQECI